MPLSFIESISQKASFGVMKTYSFGNWGLNYGPSDLMEVLYSRSINVGLPSGPAVLRMMLTMEKLVSVKFSCTQTIGAGTGICVANKVASWAEEIK